MQEITMFQGNGLSVSEYIQGFLNYLDVAPKTILTYKIALRQFCAYLNNNGIKNPTRDDIIDYREYLKENHKPNTVNAYLEAVRNLYSYLEYQDLAKDVTKNVKGIKLDQRHFKRGLSKEEIKKAINVCSDLREELLLKLMITCGLRCNEVVNIQLEDFYTDKGIVMLKVLGKARDGLKQDSVKIDDRVFEMIKQYVKEYNINDYLFTSTSNNNKGGKLTPKTIRYIVTNLFKKAELDMTMLSAHSTRHSTCEMLLEQGLPIQEVSEFMRHKNIATTMIYSKELDKRNSVGANILADAIF